MSEVRATIKNIAGATSDVKRIDTFTLEVSAPFSSDWGAMENYLNKNVHAHIVRRFSAPAPFERIVLKEKIALFGYNARRLDQLKMNEPISNSVEVKLRG